MPQEQTFRSPNSFEREIDQSAPSATGPVGVPAGVIGLSPRGPAFVPVTVGQFDEWKSIFGVPDPKTQAPYGVEQFLKHRSALTYLRVLGAGANETDGDIANTQVTGRVKNAGFKLEGNAAAHAPGKYNGAVQFLVANHSLQTNEALGLPLFTDNDSYTGNDANLVRGMIMLASGTRLVVLDGNESTAGIFSSTQPDDGATLVAGKFKLVLSSTLGNSYTNTDGLPGVKILTASLNPTSPDYFAKVLNRDPDRFVLEQHLLYADFAVDDELATATSVAVLSGSTFTSKNSGESTTNMRQAFGAFDTRYTMPKTPKFISQPFGATEYDLFHFEALDDGEFANTLYKISISNVKASTNEANQFGTFTVEIRDYNDTDSNPLVLERYPNCSLNPKSSNYVARLIGDRHVTYNFDATIESERRVVSTGKYPNISKMVRIVMNDQVENGTIPVTTLPFGFRGVEILKTNDLLTDTAPASDASRLGGVLGVSVHSALSGAILPPIPFRYKVTKGVTDGTSFDGAPGVTELTNQPLYWGVKFERNVLPLNSNLTAEKNELLSAYTKFLGIKQLDTLVTGAGADQLNNNKFTLSKVTLSNTSITHLTASVSAHMRETAYLRNAKLDMSNYTVPSTIGNRITLATILALDTPANFNRFSPFAKFTTFMYGGYDGLNFLDRDAKRMNDKSTSFDVGGGATTSYIAPGMLINPNGEGQNNSNVVSYKTAINVMTDPLTVNVNILTIPGIRESFLTDYALQKTKEYGLAYYVMDIPSYDDDGIRLYDDSTGRPDVDKTASVFDSRAVDNNYGGTYWPDIVINDVTNKRRVKVPPSVAALGAIAFNDKVAYPWFAPAGFNRAALDFVTNVAVRLNSNDRDRLSESRINSIAVFPRLGYVIWDQKTLQINKSDLDRVNVRRMLLEVKRIVIDVARRLSFEQNNADTRNKFVSEATLRVGLIKAQSGVEGMKIIMNETNNSEEDMNLNRMNGKIAVKPTKAFEYVSIDFVVTNSGVAFL